MNDTNTLVIIPSKKVLDQIFFFSFQKYSFGQIYIVNLPYSPGRLGKLIPKLCKSDEKMVELQHIEITVPTAWEAWQ